MSIEALDDLESKVRAYKILVEQPHDVLRRMSIRKTIAQFVSDMEEVVEILKKEENKCSP
jgi:hypothetical protein